MYKQLTSEQRYTISVLLQNGMKQKDIAKAINVSPSTVSREIRRNSGIRGHYNWETAQANAVRTKRKKPGNRSVDKDVMEEAKRLLVTEPKFNTYHRRILLLLYFFSFGYGLCVLQIFIFLNGAYFSFNLSYIAVACFEGLLHCRICTMSPNGFLPSVVTSFWVLILRTISVQ